MHDARITVNSTNRQDIQEQQHIVRHPRAHGTAAYRRHLFLEFHDFTIIF